MLATMYEKGVGVAADAAESAKWRSLSEPEGPAA